MKTTMGKTMAAVVVSVGAMFGAAAQAATPVITLTPQAAVSRALGQNLELNYERLNPTLTRAAQDLAESTFDPTLFSDATVTGTPGSVSASRVGLAPTSSTQASLDAGVRKTFSTGTTVEARFGTSALFGPSGGLNPAYQTGLHFDVRQNLLRGISQTANEVTITTARLGRESAQERLTRKGELVAADTLRAYWDLHAALANVSVQEVALETARKTLRETESLIAAGKQAAAEALIAKYQVQVQERSRLGAQQTLGNARDKLARLIGLVGPRSMETPNLVTDAKPETVVPATDATTLQEQALKNRADYLALKTDAQARKSEAQAAGHVLLPKLDLVASVGLQGLSGDALPGTTSGVGGGYWPSFGMNNFGWSVGLMFEMPLGNRAAEARRDVANLEVKRADATIERAEQELSEELNVVLRAARTMKEQYELTRSAAEVAQTKLQNELERYRAGKSTAQNVALMQADAVKEQLAREQALADFNKSLVELRAASGTLLEAQKAA